MGKQYVIKVNAKIHAALEDASRQTGVSIYELTDKILSGKLQPGLPMVASMGDLPSIIYGDEEDSGFTVLGVTYKKAKDLPVWMRTDAYLKDDGTVYIKKE